MNSIFEEHGGTYTLGTDSMLYPNLILESKEHRPIGRWGRMHRAYLEEHRPGLYTRLILSGQLYEHLAEIDACCSDRMDRMIHQMAETEGINDHFARLDHPELPFHETDLLRKIEATIRDAVADSLKAIPLMTSVMAQPSPMPAVNSEENVENEAAIEAFLDSF